MDTNQMDWPAKLREAAAWFDLVDRLLEVTVIEDTATGDAKRLVDRLGGPGTEIQDALRELADLIEKSEIQP